MGWPLAKSRWAAGSYRGDAVEAARLYGLCGDARLRVSALCPGTKRKHLRRQAQLHPICPLTVSPFGLATSPPFHGGEEIPQLERRRRTWVSSPPRMWGRGGEPVGRDGEGASSRRGPSTSPRSRAHLASRRACHRAIRCACFGSSSSARPIASSRRWMFAASSGSSGVGAGGGGGSGWRNSGTIGSPPNTLICGMALGFAYRRRTPNRFSGSSNGNDRLGERFGTNARAHSGSGPGRITMPVP